MCASHLWSVFCELSEGFQWKSSISHCFIWRAKVWVGNSHCSQVLCRTLSLLCSLSYTLSTTIYIAHCMDVCAQQERHQSCEQNEQNGVFATEYSSS